jgi:ERCC4-type nuclease
MFETIIALGAAFLFGAAFGGQVAYRPSDRPDSVQALLEERREDIQERYVDGRISREQFEREAGLVEDPRTEEVMYAVTDVDGVGPSVAFEIAREFPSRDDLQEASVDDLESVNQVGENRARAIRTRLAGAT